MPYFDYGQTAIDHLKRQDSKLAMAIETIGRIDREITPDLFTALIKSIVAQQISGKAAQTVWARLCHQLPEIKAFHLVNTDINAIQACGLSLRKARAIKNIAEKTVSGEIDFLALESMENTDFIKKLASLHGIGAWTAEMLLIFSLNRVDVLSWGDLAIRRGMVKLYALDGLSKEQFENYRKVYSPYGSVASFYLWAWSSR